MTTMQPPRFREDNTEGYSIDALATLNRIYDRAVTEIEPLIDEMLERGDDLAVKSYLDRLAERIAARFDRGEYGG